MVGLYTNYMGLDLKNPILVASSSLTKKIDDLKKIEENGAAAVVLKSLFQEQLMKKSYKVTGYLNFSQYSEAYDYIRNVTDDFGQQDYLNLIKKAKKELSIPIIASINCISSSGWLQYAKHIKEAGADALELNVAFFINDEEKESISIEKKYLELVQDVKNEIDLPIALKIGPYFSSFKNFVQKLNARKLDGLVLFNRFYQFDIDIDTVSLKPGNYLSSSRELNESLRWIALLSNEYDIDFSASTGIHNGEDAIKQLLAGAKTIQLCSTIYKNGFEQIKNVLNDIEKWMDDKKFKNIKEFRGKLSQTEKGYSHEYERMQYIDALIKEDDDK